MVPLSSSHQAQDARAIVVRAKVLHQPQLRFQQLRVVRKQRIEIGGVVRVRGMGDASALRDQRPGPGVNQAERSFIQDAVAPDSDALKSPSGRSNLEHEIFVPIQYGQFPDGWRLPCGRREADRGGRSGLIRRGR